MLGGVKATSSFSVGMTCQMAEWEKITSAAHSEDALFHGEGTPLIPHSHSLMPLATPLSDRQVCWVLLGVFGPCSIYDMGCAHLFHREERALVRRSRVLYHNGPFRPGLWPRAYRHHRREAIYHILSTGSKWGCHEASSNGMCNRRPGSEVIQVPG